MTSKPEITDYGDIIAGRNLVLACRTMRRRRDNRFTFRQAVSDYIDKAANGSADHEEQKYPQNSHLQYYVQIDSL
jgi:hypothetical protein